MPALAITDHGCVQAFPDANHALDRGDTFKVLYGVEGYLVDDMKEMVVNSRNQSLDGGMSYSISRPQDFHRQRIRSSRSAP